MSFGDTTHQKALRLNMLISMECLTVSLLSSILVASDLNNANQWIPVGCS